MAQEIGCKYHVTVMLKYESLAVSVSIIVENNRVRIKT